MLFWGGASCKQWHVVCRLECDVCAVGGAPSCGCASTCSSSCGAPHLYIVPDLLKSCSPKGLVSPYEDGRVEAAVMASDKLESSVVAAGSIASDVDDSSDIQLGWSRFNGPAD